jgi:ubiquinone/menaquinone biosynthesis C-methylase UbiE
MGGIKHIVTAFPIKPNDEQERNGMSKGMNYSKTSDAPYWETHHEHEEGHMRACGLLAKQIIDDYGITQGTCIDVGCGVGWLGIELAKLTDMTVNLVDIVPERLRRAAERLRRAAENAIRRGVKGKIHIERGDAQQIPFQGSSADLIVCRGALFFWEIPSAGFKEVYRILKPEGVAFLGGAMGRYLPKAEREALIASIEERVRNLGPEREREWWAKRSPQWFGKWLGAADIENFKLIPDPPGIWVEIRKTRIFYGQD